MGVVEGGSGRMGNAPSCEASGRLDGEVKHLSKHTLRSLVRFAQGDAPLDEGLHFGEVHPVGLASVTCEPALAQPPSQRAHRHPVDVPAQIVESAREEPALRQGHAVAARIGAKPLAEQLELLAQRARLELAPPDAGPPDRKQGLEELLDLTPREAEVLTLLARGCTNREIAAALVISVRTAGVHVSHILRKLGAPNRLEAAAIAHRLSPPRA